MKVLVFSTLYPNEQQTQHGVFVENGLKTFVANHNVEVRVCAPVPWFPLKNEIFGQYASLAKIAKKERRHGISIDHPRYPVIPKFGMNISPWLLAKAMLPVLKSYIDEGFDFDIIDAHFCYPDGVAAIWLAQQLNKPVMVSALGSDINLYRHFKWPNRHLLKWLPQASAISAVCQALIDTTDEMGIGCEHKVVLRNGVNLELFKPNDTESSVDLKTLVIVGNLVEVKQHHLLIDAMSLLPDDTLKIIGEGPLKQSLTLQAEQLGLVERISFLGRLKQPDMIPHIQSAGALILCSQSEGWANVLLESMACGTPVVATAVGGTPEVVTSESKGILVEKHTPKALAEAILTLFQCYPDRVDVRNYAEQFSWDETAAVKYKLFQQLIAKRN